MRVVLFLTFKFRKLQFVPSKDRAIVHKTLSESISAKE